MSTCTTVVPLDPVSPRELFDAARKAAGDPKNWTLHDGPDYGDLPMYITHDNPRADARVIVHYPAAGGLFPPEQEPGAPGCYAVARFTTSAFGSSDAGWRHHAGLVRKLGQWLDACGVRWAWSFEDDPWLYVTVPPERGART